MFTPQEVSEKVFPKASFGSGGYTMSAVDEFLDTLTEDYTALYKENVALKAKLKVLAEKIENLGLSYKVMLTHDLAIFPTPRFLRIVEPAETDSSESLAS